jgi:ribosomal protein S18 acetylase RimI-like enzyme
MEWFALVMTLVGLVWLVSVVPGVVQSWKAAPIYYNLARLILPGLIVAAFLPRLFYPGYPANPPIFFWILVGLLVYTFGAVLFYLYTQPGDYSPRPILNKTGEMQLLTQDGAIVPMVDHRLDETITVRPACLHDLPGAGYVFAEVFGHTFDLSFGTDRERNGQILGDLLKLKQNEVLVALDSREQVVGALWLDLADPATRKAEYSSVYPLIRQYMNFWYAFYLAFLGVPGMMAVRGNREQGYVQWLGVLPQWQGHHVARKLMNKAEELARQAGKKTLALHTERANQPARQLYEHLGFSEHGFFRFTPRVYYVKDLS